MDLSEKDDVNVATEKLEKSKVDSLTMTQFRKTMLLAGMAVDELDPDKKAQLSARALLAQSVAIAHFAAESPTFAESAAERAAHKVGSMLVAAHVDDCERKRQAKAQVVTPDDVPWSVIWKRMALKSPYAVAMIMVALVLRGYGGKIIDFFL
jgi:hypothetical protein